MVEKGFDGRGEEAMAVEKGCEWRGRIEVVRKVIGRVRENCGCKEVVRKEKQ